VRFFTKDRVPVRSTPAADTDRVAVLIEPRRHALLEFSIRHTMHMLGPGWALQIYDSRGNRDMVLSILGPGHNATLTSLEDDLGCPDAETKFNLLHLQHLQVWALLLWWGDGTAVQAPSLTPSLFRPLAPSPPRSL
jgi:hypothetical protein